MKLLLVFFTLFLIANGQNPIEVATKSVSSVIELVKLVKQLSELLKQETESTTKTLYVKSQGIYTLETLPLSFRKTIEYLQEKYRGYHIAMYFQQENVFERTLITNQQSYNLIKDGEKIEIEVNHRRVKSNLTPVSIGIDLGASFSTVSYWLDGSPRIIKINGNSAIPSTVTINHDDSFEVGANFFHLLNVHIAQRMDISESERLSSITNKMGYTFNVNEGVFEIQSSKRTIYKTLEEISSIFLSYLYDEIQFELNRLDLALDCTVITIPASFNHNQRISTINAAKIAGFSNIQLLKETVAIACTLNPLGIDHDIIVIDIGGTTFDLSIVRMGENSLSVLYSISEPIGGFDMTLNLVEHVKSRYESEASFWKRYTSFSVDISEIFEKSEKLKIELSKLRQGSIEIKGTQISVTRDTFEKINDTIWEKISSALKEILKQYMRDHNKILKEVIVAGGSSNIPKIKEIIRSFKFTEIPLPFMHKYNEQEIVSIGASYFASHDSTLELRDTLPNRINILLYNNVSDSTYYYELFSKNTVLPASKVIKTTTILPCQKNSETSLFEELPNEENVLIGSIKSTFEYPDPCDSRGKSKHKISIDKNGLIHHSIDTNYGGQYNEHFSVNTFPHVMNQEDVEKVIQLHQIENYFKTLLQSPNNRVVELYNEYKLLVTGNSHSLPKLEQLLIELSNFCTFDQKIINKDIL